MSHLQLFYMEFIQHFGKHKVLTSGPWYANCFYFPIWQVEIMITASPVFISLTSPLFSCSCSHSGFMVLFCPFSLSPSSNLLLPLLYVSLSLSVSDHLFLFLCHFLAFLFPVPSGPSTIKSTLQKSKKSIRQRKSMRKPISRERQLLM